MCLPNPCKNGGTCLQLGSFGFVCQCPSNCNGYNCSTCSTTTQTTTSTTTKTTTKKTTVHNKVEEITKELFPIENKNDEKGIVAVVSTITTTANKADCQNLNKKFCKKFRDLTKCKRDHNYLGVSLKSYCCELCL